MIPKEKQKEFIQHLYPEGDKLKERETKYLTRSAALICATYAYHRCVLPNNAFKFVKILNRYDVPVFDKAFPKAKLNIEAIAIVSKELRKKNITNFIFAVCEENDAAKIVESLRFEFDYNNASMHVQLPNATNVRVTSQWDFSHDLAEVLKRIRLLSDHLAALPKKVTSSIIIEFKNKPTGDALPPTFKYGNYDAIQNVLESLPIAKLKCEPQGLSMMVELRSKYFGAAAKDIQKEVEEALGVDDESMSNHPSDFVGSSPSRQNSVDTSLNSRSIEVHSIRDSPKKAAAPEDRTKLSTPSPQKPADDDLDASLPNSQDQDDNDKVAASDKDDDDPDDASPPLSDDDDDHPQDDDDKENVATRRSSASAKHARDSLEYVPETPRDTQRESPEPDQSQNFSIIEKDTVTHSCDMTDSRKRSLSAEVDALLAVELPEPKKRRYNRLG